MADVEQPPELEELPPPLQTAAAADDRPRVSVATPENDNDDNEGYAEAAAEVAAMNPNLDPATIGRQQRPTATGQQPRAERDTTATEQAVMGAAAEGVGGFEIIDESGELVKGRFLDFLQEYRERITVPPPTADPEDSDMDDDDDDENVQYYYPYIEQAAQIAQRQLLRRSSDDDDGHDDNNGAPQSGVFSNTLFVDFSHLLSQDEELAEAIQNDAVRFEPFLQRASKTFVLDLHPELDQAAGGAAGSTCYFVAFHNLPTILPVRHLRTDRIGRLSAVTGTITRTSEVRPELLVASFRCTKCGLLAEHIRQQYHYTRPTLCRNPRCQNRSSGEFTLEIPKSEFCDWQKLRVQENSEEIPPGSMPRSMDIVVRNEMVERAKAGDKCVFVGSLVVIPDGSALARAGEAPRSTAAGMRRGISNNNETATGGGGGVRGLKALGVRELTYRTCFVASCVLEMDAVARLAQQQRTQAAATTGKQLSSQNPTATAMASLLFGPASQNVNEDPTAQEVAMEFTESEREDIRNMKSSARLYQQMVQSIAPGTFGHAEVKRGILLMLLGGVHKTTAEGMKLRGDINVCIVGDPSTAKSQFLKYVHAFLPSRAIYTSGKASSAAGLTAAVQRDQDTGEYCIEAGALMLADNGICCIDEFDKMDPTDQVAIHEAMEQQTISITKAGIQATLNARASILAAANPIYGRYDRTKTLKANVALSAPILSRFDLFFVVLDECDEEADFKVAQHILNVHRCQEEAVRPPFTKEQMQRYIRFARTLNPKLTVESQRVLVDCYRKLRQGDTLGRSRTAYRITVRQLESMIRLSEALARLHCDDEIQPAYVREAFRLLKKSIIHVETEDVTFENEDDDDNDDNDDNNSNDAPMDVDDHPNATSRPSQDATGAQHPGEYNGEAEDNGNVISREQDRPTPSTGPTSATTDKETNVTAKAEQPRPTKKRKKSKKKTQITFEQFEAISNAIATYLRSLENDSNTSMGENDEGKSGIATTTMKKYVTWGEVVEWYLEQCEEQIGDSLEELERMRKLTNLVIRRLIDVDNILIRIGSSEAATSREEEQLTRVAVHPNFVVS